MQQFAGIFYALSRYVARNFSKWPAFKVTIEFETLNQKHHFEQVLKAEFDHFILTYSRPDKTMPDTCCGIPFEITSKQKYYRAGPSGGDW